MRNLLTYLLLLLVHLTVLGQVDYTRKHWAFGRNALLSFDQNGITSIGTTGMNGYQGTACYSNKAGDLVLSTNGNGIYGTNNELLNVVFARPETEGNPDALILPKNDEETQFYIFIIESGAGLRTVDVDLVAKTAILRPAVFNLTGYAFKMTAVKHCFSNAYWLIFPDNANTFYSFLVKPNSISEPVVSKVASNRGNLGDFVSSHDGTMLALSSYLGDWAELYDFDKKCGTVSNARELKSSKDIDNKPHGISFAPDDKSVFVAWSHQQSNLYRYDIEFWGSISNIYSSQENINDVMVSIDGNMYMNVHENGNPSKRIHIITDPNGKEGGGTSVIEDVATLSEFTNGAFEFPSFISSHTGGGCGEVGDFQKVEFIENRNRCLNAPVKFSAIISDHTYDSIRWNFDDPTSADNFSSEHQVIKYFDEARTYNVRCYAYYCSFVDSFYLPLTMVSPPIFSLGNDSTLCYGDSMQLTVPQPYDTFIWTDGYPFAQRVVQEGEYIAKALVNTCIVIDTVALSSYPAIWTALQSEYFICDLESETTLVDAGSGFKRYKWLPTGDSTQWIIVQDLGEYIVIVDAFTGCTGNGTTVVKRRCNFTYKVPNAFSPNNDKLNDTFKIVGEYLENAEVTIYNRWGEQLYRGSEWDGVKAPNGVYFYTATVKGYHNRLPVTKHISGIVHLIR